MPAFTTVGNTSIATDQLASAYAKSTLRKNSSSVARTSASILQPRCGLVRPGRSERREYCK
jgi:hypothetical protein